MKKRILSVLLCLCLVYGLMPTTAALASEEMSSWEKFYDVDYLNCIISNYDTSYNTEEDALQVSTPEQLAAVAVFSNMDYSNHFSGKYVELTADIDISDHVWLPITIPEYEIDGERQLKFYRGYGFAGTFIGNNHSVTGLTLNDPSDSLVGLFGAIAPNGIVSGVKVSGTIFGTWNLGGITAHNYYGTISNCESNLKISTSGYCVGGIAGQNSGTIINCTARGEIISELLPDFSSGGNVGGIAGWSGGSISGCRNESDILGSTRVGGIVGRAQNASVTSDCTNIGTVNAIDCCGGIAGLVSSANAQIADCCNVGKISIIENDNVTQSACAGGICGSNAGVVLSCVNKGDVECYNQDNRAGGIVGFNQGIVRCSINQGNISAKLTTKLSEGTASGGIVGYLYMANGHPIIEQCYNQGSVSKGMWSGGISGFAASYSTITNCYNMGSVSSAAYAAGITAFNNAIVSHCYNVGNVDRAQAKGGISAIVGVANLGYDCYYLDTCCTGNGTTVDDGAKCTSEQMKQQSNFAGFDFTNIWTMAGDSSYLYPELKKVEMPTAKLEIVTQPEDQTVAAGEKARLSVTATGSGLKYQWQWSVNGTPWANTTLAGYNTSTLTITASATVNGRQYRCVITDSNGKTVTSDAAKLTVGAALKITTQPGDQTVAAGAKAKFSVTASGSGLKYQWQWSSNGTTWANTSLTGCNTPTLTVTASDTVNGRQYRCVITDSSGNTVTSGAATLTVGEALKITTQPEDQTVVAGAKAKFSVTASGSG